MAYGGSGKSTASSPLPLPGRQVVDRRSFSGHRHATDRQPNIPVCSRGITFCGVAENFSYRHGFVVSTLLNPGPGVTYCDRYQKLAAKFAGLNCTADLTTGEVTCTDPEELQLILKTLSAHHFNFLHANAVPGVQKVEVQAMAQAAVELGGSKLGAAGAEAFAGAGALSVGIIRLVKDANGTTDLGEIR